MSAAITAVVQTSAAGVAAELERLAQELAKAALAEVREACGAVSEETAAFIAARACEEASAMYARAVESVTDLPFTLLADTDLAVAKAFGVPTVPVLGVPKRQSFLIKDGKVVWIVESAKTGDHAAEVRDAIAKFGRN